MNLLVDQGVVKCAHDGSVQNRASQRFVTIQGMPVLIADDPVGRHIVACPNAGLNLKPCTTTHRVLSGYSTFVTVSGHAVCLETLEGVTDGVDAQPQVLYTVRRPGQTFVGAGA